MTDLAEDEVIQVRFYARGGQRGFITGLSLVQAQDSMTPPRKFLPPSPRIRVSVFVRVR